MDELIRRANELLTEQTQLVAERQRLKLDILLRNRDTMQRHKRIVEWDNHILMRERSENPESLPTG